MYRPRNKYFKTNNGNLVERIMSSDKFTRYEYMALRYACCESISKIDYVLSGYTVPYIAYMRRIDIKNLKNLIRDALIIWINVVLKENK